MLYLFHRLLGEPPMEMLMKGKKVNNYYIKYNDINNNYDNNNMNNMNDNNNNMNDNNMNDNNNINYKFRLKTFKEYYSSNPKYKYDIKEENKFYD